MADPHPAEIEQAPEKVKVGDNQSTKAENKAGGEAESGKDTFYENITKQQRALMKAREDGLRTGTHADFGTPTIEGTSIKGGPPSPATLTEQQLKERMNVVSNAQGSAELTDTQLGKLGAYLSKDSAQEQPLGVIAQNVSDGTPSRKQQEAPLNSEGSKTQSADEAWLERREKRQENYQNDIAEQLKDALYTPRDGQTWKLSDFLSHAHSPITDAYELSKHLKEGQSGKSKTLEGLVDRLKECPWAGQIQINFDAHATHPEYDDSKSTITINPNDPPWKQLDNFAHESFHATHQGLRDLYLNGPITDKQKYVQAWAGLEIGSFKAEIGVHNELSSHMPGAGDVLYKWADKDGKPQADMDLSKLYREKGEKGLYDFIMDQAHTVMKIDGKFDLHTYRQYYESTHQAYLASFDRDKKHINSWLNEQPKLKDMIERKDF